MRWLRLLLLALVLPPCVARAGKLDRPVVRIFVSPRGNDSGKGSSASPVRTIARGLVCARDVRSDALREVVLADGLYELDEPVALDGNDWEVTVRAEHPGKAVVTGAKRLSGWKPDEKDPRFLVAALPFKPAADILMTLVVGGESRPLATYPGDGRNVACPAVLGDGTNFTNLPYAPGTFPEGYDPANLVAEGAWVTVPQEWASTRSAIKAVNAEGRALTLARRTAMPIGRFNTGFKIMNARLGMRQPGDWMYEAGTGKVVYWPKEGETAKTIDASISRIVSLFAVNVAANVTISGLALTGCATPFAPSSRAFPAAAAICSRYAAGLTVKDCEIFNCAGTGIFLWKASRTLLADNRIHDLGAGGIDFFDGGEMGCEVRGNEVFRIGRISPASVGIAMQIRGIRCIGNYVHDNPGNGLVLWGRFNLVENNRLDDNMLVQRDGGGLYGAYDYTVVRGNTCRYRKPSAWPALYADEGSQHTVFVGNRVEGTWWPTHVHCAQHVAVSNNLFHFDGAMRFSFQGSAHCSFTDNKICGARGFDRADYLVNCDRWANNDVYLKTENGKFRKQKTLSFDIPKQPQYETGVIVATRTGGVTLDGKDAPGEYGQKTYWLQRLADARGYVGCPMSSLKVSYDDTYLYFHSRFIYSVLTPYSGRICVGNGWTAADGIRLVFSGNRRMMTLYADGTVESSGVLVTKADAAVAPETYFRETAGYELRVPLASLGLVRGEGWAGQEIGFNAVAYNADHYEKHFLFSPEGGKVLSGKIVFGGGN